MSVTRYLINPIKGHNLIYSNIFLILIGSLTLALFIFNNKHLTVVNMDTAKSILNTIMCVTGSFLGFFVLYLSISLENFKRNYGQYALEIFRKNKLVLSVVFEFLFIIILGLFALMFIDRNNWFSVLLFNLVCYYFSITLLLLVPYGSEILVESSSKEIINKLIQSLSEKDFPNEPTRDFWNNESMYYLIAENDNNRVNNIAKILHHNISSSNRKISVNILSELSSKIEIIIDDKSVDNDAKRKVFLAHLNILQTAFNHCDKKIDTIFIQVILFALKGCSLIIAKHHYGKAYIEKLFELTAYVITELIESENENLIEDSFWAYYHMCDAQLSNNIPQENEIWDFTNTDYLMPIKTEDGYEKVDKFNAIEHAVSFQFNNLVERAFLCKNYYVIENVVRMIGSFIEMIIFNNNLESYQKFRIGSMLAFNASGAIKKFADNKYPNQYSYLNFYVGTSHIQSLLHENSSFSQSVFDYYVDIFAHLVETDNFSKLDSEEISGLCRLIIANSKGVNDVNIYVEKIMKTQKKLKQKIFRDVISKTFKQKEIDDKRLLASNIENDFKSYLNIMERETIVNDSLKATITKYV